MNRNVNFNKVIEEGPENIEIVVLVKDRIIFRPIKVVPKQTSKILDQDGNPIESHTWDRWPVRGEVVHVGKEVKELYPEIVPGSLIFIEDPRAGSGIEINGENLAMTRTSNIFLVYNDLNKDNRKKK